LERPGEGADERAAGVIELGRRTPKSNRISPSLATDTTERTPAPGSNQGRLVISPYGPMRNDVGI